nr:transposase [Sinorhizobium meliloti]
MSATLRAHDQLIQDLRLRIARLRKQAFGKSSEKIEREIQQLELALEDLLIAASENSTKPIDDDDEIVPEASADPSRREGDPQASTRIRKGRTRAQGNRSRQSLPRLRGRTAPGG